MAIHNSPVHVTTFLGRQSELHDLSDLLAVPDCRLLTLTGLGGIGKTRLALALAEQIQDLFPDGAYFVPLQPLQSSDQIIASINTTLGVQADQKPLEQLLAWLHDKHLLLVLDNFEHLMDGVGLLTDLLAVAPRVKLLTTSRDALRLQSEWLRQLHGLEYPDADSLQPDTDYSAVQLFIERARQRRGDLDIEAQYRHIARICQIVEGMPLALELVAGWVKSLSCAEIVTELERSDRILRSRTQDMPTQHRSMEVVFDHSWHLLTDEERAVLQSCSVFRGGCTREAAEQVTRATLTVLTSLVEKSLLRHDSDGGRYDLHELLRQYAAEKLDQSPEIREALLDRHCDYYTEFLHQQEATIHLNDQGEVLNDLDNLRIAWKHAVQQRNLAALQRAAPSLNWLYHFQGWDDEGAAMFYLAEETLREMESTDEGRFLLGMIQLFRGFFQPDQPGWKRYPPVDIGEALALWEGLEERPEMGLPLTRALLTLIRDLSDPAQVIAVAHKSIAFSTRHNDLPGVAIALVTLANVHFEAFGELAKAQQLCEEALAIDRQIGFELNARWAEGTLGAIASMMGQYGEAKTHYEAHVAHHYAGGISRSLDSALFSLGSAELEVGDDTAAREHFEEGLAVAHDQQRHWGIANGQAELGILAAFQGDSHAAAAHYETSQAYLRSGGLNSLSCDKEPESLDFLALLLGYYDHALAHYEAMLSRYGDAGYRVPLMRANGRIGQALLGLSDETQTAPYFFEALREAADVGALQVLLEALLGIAQLSSVLPTVAVELLTVVHEHPAANRYSRHQADRILMMMRTLLPEDAFCAAVERGHALSPEAAVSLVKPTNFDLGEMQLKANQQLADPLSLRELEVLVCITEGRTNQEIADQLYIGISTVKKHINHIYSKLDVKNRIEAIHQARALRLIA